MAVARGKIDARHRRTAVADLASKNGDLQRPNESGMCRTGWIGSQAQGVGSWGRGALL